MCTSFTMLCSSTYAHSWHFTVLLVPDKLRNNEMLPCGNLIFFGPCVTRCKIITCTKGIQGSKNSPHFHKPVIGGGVGELSVPGQHMGSVWHAWLLSPPRWSHTWCYSCQLYDHTTHQIPHSMNFVTCHILLAFDLIWFKITQMSCALQHSTWVWVESLENHLQWTTRHVLIGLQT